MSWVGWAANALLCIQWWALGHKRRYGMLLGAAAGCMWAYVAVSKGMWDLLTIEVILSVLQLRAWILWGSNERYLPTDCPVCSGPDCQQ